MWLFSIPRQLREMRKEMEKMTAEMQRLSDLVDNSITTQEEAISLLEELAELLRAGGGGPTPAEINEIADRVEAETIRLRQAVTDNTPPA